VLFFRSIRFSSYLFDELSNGLSFILSDKQ